MDASRHRRHMFFAQQHSRPLGEVAQRVSKLLPTEEEGEGRGGGYGGGAVENPIGAQNSNNNNNSNNYRNDYDNGDDDDNDDDEKSNKINTEEEEEKNNKDDPASTTTTTTTHLVIHFDINETILVGDEAGGDTVTDSFHKMLAKSAFVQVPTQERMVVQIKQEKELKISNRSKDGTQQQEQEKQQQEQESQAYYYYEKTSHMVPTHWWNGLPIQSSREEYEQYHLNSIDNKNNNINNGEEKSLWNADDNHQQQEEAGEELTGTSSAATTTTTTTPALLVPPLYTGWTWPSHCVPYYRTKIRKTMGSDFCNHIGSIYSETFHQMKVTMAETVAAAAAIPATSESTIAAAASSSTTAGTTQQHHCKLFPHLLPAFFETLLFLSSSSTSQNLKWTLVFRTFGSDMTDLAQAVTAFARGQHPLYPNFRDERFVLDEKRQLFRGKWAPRRNGRISSSSSSSSFEPNNHLLLDRNVDGTTTTSTATTTTKDASYGADHVYQLWNHAGDTLVASDEDGILHLLHSPEITICGITDDYSFWSANDCQPWAGKPVWKPCSDDGNDRHGQQQQEQQPPINDHHILFDDCIHNLETDCIASIRRRRRLRRRTPTQTKDHGKESDPDNDDDDYYYESLVPRDSLAQHGVHLIRVPTVEPMLDSQWFIRQIQQARRKFLA